MHTGSAWLGSVPKYKAYNDQLPSIAELALKLPQLFQKPLPRLVKGQEMTLTLIQLQAACLWSMLSSVLYVIKRLRVMKHKGPDYGRRNLGRSSASKRSGSHGFDGSGSRSSDFGSGGSSTGGRGEMYGFVSSCIEMYGFVSSCIEIYGFVSICIKIYGFVSSCIKIYGFVSSCIEINQGFDNFIRSTSKKLQAKLLSTKILKSGKSCGNITSQLKRRFWWTCRRIFAQTKNLKPLFNASDCAPTKTFNTLQHKPSIIPRNIYNSSQVQS
ncbi:hypothetical protein HELRODRAFT_182712 [Helobdella robusta]|uniref:PARG helical domain-containing protein n=1 Tax=Helobdella robusta TaxID=6412 RepID=T1FIM6_HELRO|nr:hypothetical protein HELRODRAFT_182712 [Helobdella robusta]ESN90215.1 hypothetical protein HELRODRAFT_182712 [Helobdella robusta]